MPEDARPKRLPTLVRNILRLAWLGGTVASHTLAVAVHASGRAGATGSSDRRRPGYRIRFRRRWLDELPGLITRLGPTFVKVAQILATRRDLVSPELCASLAGLSDQVPPPPAEEIASALVQAYGVRLPFVWLDRVPVASGSIATVHLAELDDGVQVAVKIRRPGLESVMPRDLDLLLSGLRFLACVPGLRGVPLPGIGRQIAAGVRQQLDFVAERESLDSLVRLFEENREVTVPRVVAGLCTSNIVVMEYMTDLATCGVDEVPAADRRAAAENTLHAVYRMLFGEGLVHCDLHPGNLYLRPTADLVILDAGFVVQLPEKVRRLFAAFFMNMALGRGWRCADIVIESSDGLSSESDLDGFRAAMTGLIDRSHRLAAAEFNLAAFAAQLFLLQRKHGLYAAPEFAMPLLALLVVEGMVSRIDPSIDFQAVALPYLIETLLPSDTN